MGSFRDEIIRAAREHQAESRKHVEESQAKKIKRWQAFRNAYEYATVQLADIDGLKLEPKTKDGQVVATRHLSVRRIEPLPAEPVTDDRVYLVELWLCHSDGKEFLLSGWVLHWRTWDNDNKVKRTYLDDDACWRSLTDDCLHKTATVLGETVKSLKYKIDLEHYEAEVNQRGLDL